MKLPGATHLVILTWQRWQAERIYRILQLLLRRLGLTLSPEKTRVVNLQEKEADSISSATTIAGSESLEDRQMVRRLLAEPEGDEAST